MMLGRHVYRVHPTEQGWTVTKEGEDHPRSGFPDREQAIAEAVRLAESDEPAKVTVDTGDGTIVDGFINNVVASGTREAAREASRLQTGYVYHYAFAMLIGVAAFATWYLFGGIR